MTQLVKKHVLPMDEIVVQEVVTLLSAHFKRPIQIKAAVELSESKRRNGIFRLYLEYEGLGGPSSIILKQSRIQPGTASSSSNEDEEALGRLSRDWAGLEFLSEIATQSYAPRFYGGSMEHRFVLLEDLGEEHLSLVDSLTGGDPDGAERALHRYMKALGQFHGHAYQALDLYDDLLRKCQPTPESWQEHLVQSLAGDLPSLEKIMDTLGVSLTSEVREEINAIYHARLAPGPFTTLVHGDICPDNIFDDPAQETLYFIDFEWTFVRNALSDGTYLRMSMPTCWCAKAIPSKIIDACETTYRDELVKHIPAVQDDQLYYTAYTQACGFWALKAVLLLTQVLDKDEVWGSGPVSTQSLWKKEENFVRPRVLSRLQAFMDVASQYETLPHMQALARDVLYALNKRWSDVKPLDLYPAFKENSLKNEGVIR